MIAGMGPISAQYDTYGMAADSTAAWVYNGETGNLFRIDPKTNSIVATIPVGLGCAPHANCGGVALGQGAIWVMASAAGKLVRVDPQTNQIVATISYPIVKDPPQALNVFVTPGAVWVTDYYGGAIFRIDPQTNKQVAVFTPVAGPTGVGFGAGSLWECEAHNTAHGLTRLDPATMQVQAQIDVSDNGRYVYCLGLIALDQAVWVVAGDGENVVMERVDPATNKLAATAPPPGAQGTGFAADAQGVWALDVQAGLYRLDPQSGQAVGVVALSGGLGLAVGAGAVWVVKSDGTLLHITPAS
jgi:streptogramin lyase